jgi:tetratricopeptide (TPR) repeat protein
MDDATLNDYIRMANECPYQSLAEATEELLRKGCPDRGLALRLLGIARWRIGDSAAALEALDEADALLPASCCGLAARLGCLLDLGRRRAAAATLRRLLTLEGLSLDLLPNLAAMLGQRGEPALALMVCRLLARRLPKFPDVWFGIGYYLGQLGAEPCWTLPPLERAQALSPHCWLARLNLASTYARVERWNEAADLLDGIHPEALTQPFWLCRMMEIAAHVERLSLVERCERRLAELASEAPH